MNNVCFKTSLGNFRQQVPWGTTLKQFLQAKLVGTISSPGSVHPERASMLGFPYQTMLLVPPTKAYYPVDHSFKHIIGQLKETRTVFCDPPLRKHLADNLLFIASCLFQVLEILNW